MIVTDLSVPSTNEPSSNSGELECRIPNLLEGQRYFIRASFGNPKGRVTSFCTNLVEFVQKLATLCSKGFGPFSGSTPKSVVPSTWRSVEDRTPRLSDAQLRQCQSTYQKLAYDNTMDSTEVDHDSTSASSHQTSNHHSSM